VADSALDPSLTAAAAPVSSPRHTAVVRVTHWIIALSFIALLVTGIEILISHPRFYWGEEGTWKRPRCLTCPFHPLERRS